MEKIFTEDFWTNIFLEFKQWTVTEGPSLIILLITIFVLFRLSSLLMGKLKTIIIKHTQKKGGGESEKRANTLIGISKGVIRIIIWTVFLMILLKKLGLDIGPLLASAGILGLAIGFGAQELVRDFISGFFILLENQIRTGDVAIINGTSGMVERIELRTTILRDFSGVVHVFQNGKINTLSNMTKEWSAIVVEVGVAYKEDADRVMQLMEKVAKELREDPEMGPKIIEDIEIFGIENFMDSALLFKARIKTHPIEQWRVARKYRVMLKKAFDEHNIEIPFPHRTIHWGENINQLNMQVNSETNDNQPLKQ